NGQNFCAARPIEESVNGTRRALCATLNDIDQWDIVNTTNDTHPFHIHVNPVQITQMNGVEVSPPNCTPAVFEDTISLPMNPASGAGGSGGAGGAESASGSGGASGAGGASGPGLGRCDAASLSTAGFAFRTKYTDYTGDPVFHCHILLHEDQSMMGRFTIA